MALEQLPIDPETEQLIELYATAEARLAAQITQAVAAGNLIAAAYRRSRLTAVRELLTALHDQAHPRAVQLIDAAYRFGVRLVTGRITADFGTGVHQEALQVLADNLAHDLEAATITVGRRAQDVLRKEGLRHSALHLLEGSTRRAAGTNLADALVRQGTTALRDRGGRTWGLERYAAMAIRTTTREAVSAGTRAQMLANGLDLVTITAHVHPHDECSPYDGKTFSLTGLSDQYPHLDRLPPFHPNCSHVMSPARIIPRD